MQLGRDPAAVYSSINLFRPSCPACDRKSPQKVTNVIIIAFFIVITVIIIMIITTILITIIVIVLVIKRNIPSWYVCLVSDKLSNSPNWVRRHHSCCLDLVLNNGLKGIFPLCGAAVEDHQGIKWKGERMHLRFRKFPKVLTSHNSGGEGQLGGMEINKTSLRSSP